MCPWDEHWLDFLYGEWLKPGNCISPAGAGAAGWEFKSISFSLEEIAWLPGVALDIHIVALRQFSMFWSHQNKYSAQWGPTFLQTIRCVEPNTILHSATHCNALAKKLRDTGIVLTFCWISYSLSSCQISLVIQRCSVAGSVLFRCLFCNAEPLIASWWNASTEFVFCM